MERSTLKVSSVYKGTRILLPTKHQKASAIAPYFREILKSNVEEYIVDTDALGTFSGEIERTGNALECARKKCELAIENLGVDFVIASEGSFGPHPFMPFFPCDHEILYFIDRKHGFHLHLSLLSEKTNYQMKEIDSLEALKKFAEQAQFPSHALIVRPNNWQEKSIIFKGIVREDNLEIAFKESIKHSHDNKAWVETDMRAQFNPSRMKVIAELAEKLAERLTCHCPKCNTPGWGKISVKTGLPCKWCAAETEMVKYEIFGCTKCNYKETANRSDGVKEADPGSCQYCNP